MKYELLVFQNIAREAKLLDSLSILQFKAWKNSKAMVKEH